MDTQLSLFHQGRSLFDGIRQIRPDGSEYWSARDLQPLLGYDRWERVPEVLERAMAACENSGHKASDQFRGASKMIQAGKGAAREIDDCHLTRYACYLVAMNGDPRKPEIAAAQTYFAVQTHRQEQAAAQFQRPMSLAELSLMHAQALVEQERRLSALTDRQQMVEAKVNAIEARQREAEEELSALPVPAGDVPDLSTRALLNRLVRGYCLENGYGHSEAWGRLYLEFRDRQHIDLKARTRGRKMTQLDVADQLGLIDELYALAYELFGPERRVS